MVAPLAGARIEISDAAVVRRKENRRSPRGSAD